MNDTTDTTMADAALPTSADSSLAEPGDDRDPDEDHIIRSVN